MAAGRLLVVEDRDSLRRMLERALTDEGYQVEAAADGEAALKLLAESSFDLVLTDLKLPDRSGLEVLAASRQRQPNAPVLVLTGYGSVGAAVEAMKLGAYDFLEKPLELDDLARLVSQAIGRIEEDAVFTAPGTPPIVGRHAKLRTALRLVARVARTESTVLLTGESGTGKELFARALHGLSGRSSGPLVTLNCAAIPETLIENELFGHERGAFTGADRRQPGRFELARGGTLFLDEIGELPLAVQGKVLRVLEERTFERIGSGQTLEANVRLVAATNRHLRTMVDAGVFRADLFFRLDIFPIELPPLRERASDVPLLAAHLLNEICRRHELGPRRLDDAASELLAAQHWEGNVRELANLLERAAILGESSVIRESDLRPLLGVGRIATVPTERERLRQALNDASGDKKKAALLAGMTYRTLLRKVREHDLEGIPKYRQ